ncbi:carboxypeptidase M32 [Cytobacillus kochii]|uniref:carboxypeptidase M32 n=1 Tax=Cytobacillus kochii TaxID=859143 RepID=UPI00384A82B7
MDAMITNVENEFLAFVKKVMAYKEAVSLMHWDLRTGAPRKGAEQRAETIGMLSSEIFAMCTSEEMAAYIGKLSDEQAKNKLSERTNRLVEVCKKEYNLNKKIPADEFREYVSIQSHAETVWEEAREKSDFSMFLPYLEKLVDYNKRFINYWGYKEHKYNTLLDHHEPGMTVKTLDEVFGQLRQSIVPLVKEVAQSQSKPETDFLYATFPKEKQKEFTIQILNQMGYDFEAGRLDDTVHPFATGINSGDYRITTRYDENDFRMAVFGTIHEGGHAIYEQNISKELENTPLHQGTSTGIHESQSLFYENFVSRHKGFWQHNFALLNQYAPDQFDGITLDEFYHAINESKPSMIRIEADELTYPLHIMIRYELEKALFNDEIEVKDLPQLWNEKYEEYLGITPKNDAEGVLQDVHWASGSFGYFPSYALGYMYAAQLKQSMLKSIPEFDQLLEEGNLTPIREWLTEIVHRYGRMKEPLEIIQSATGEGLNVQYLIDYLTDKYRAIYQLN